MFESAMRQALECAERGPLAGGNPRVGCVLVDEKGSVVAEGWHRGAGTSHAEIDALKKVESAAGLTAVVTLEPCNHTGRTGPCAEALIEAGIARVVYAVSDPGALSGGGAERLRSAGIEVIEGVLAAAGEALIEHWLTAERRGLPWVTAKWGSSLDGKVAAADGTSQWITSVESRNFIHEKRSENDIIVVGTGTAIADDPSLTARTPNGDLYENQPKPVVIGKRTIADGAALYCHPRGFENKQGELKEILAELYAAGARRVFLEGGPTLVGSFISQGLVDEFIVCIAPILLGGNNSAMADVGVSTMSEAVGLRVIERQVLGEDTVLTLRKAGK
jgi:diaminohydroxyphosphoribosylaminopyrimidine deaminase/5-amino-6-(5-phosphoribosylamino)uracil reductase